MSKQWLDSNEWFPVYHFVREESIPEIEADPSYAKYFTSVEMPDDKVEWVKQVFADFAEVQAYLRTFIKERTK